MNALQRLLNSFEVARAIRRRYVRYRAEGMSHEKAREKAEWWYR